MKDDVSRVRAKLERDAKLSMAEQENDNFHFFVPLTGFLGDSPPDDDGSEDWLIEGVIARGEAGIISGPPKSSKTYAALDLAVCLAAERDWCGFRNTLGRPARVLVLAMEDSERRLRQRVWALLAGHGLSPEQVAAGLVINGRDFFYFDYPVHVRQLKFTLEYWEPDLLIVDSLARSFRGDENSKRELAELTQPWQELCRQHKLAVVVIHHDRKHAGADDSPMYRMRGSGDIAALARWIVSLRRATGARGQITLEAMGNVGPDVEPTALELELQCTTTAVKSARFVRLGPAADAANADLDRRIVAALQEHGPMVAKEIERLVNGKSLRIRARLTILDARGVIEREKPGKPYSVVRPPPGSKSPGPPYKGGTRDTDSGTPRDTRDTSCPSSQHDSALACPGQERKPNNGVPPA